VVFPGVDDVSSNSKFASVNESDSVRKTWYGALR